ncbi:hypothetical protein [Flavobacterium beibuense]|uniref:hypothetical protein n=1 Tax=Flavobacterium beibuense TaxID=657326 RepID=UPI003A9221CF
MKIKEANKLIAEYMGEKIINSKGYVSIEVDGIEESVGYHTSSEWLLPVINKLQKENKLSNKLEETIFYMYSDVIKSIISFS